MWSPTIAKSLQTTAPGASTTNHTINHHPPHNHNERQRKPQPGREATLKQRIRVIQKRALGMSYRAIGADVGLSKDAALKICRN